MMERDESTAVGLIKLYRDIVRRLVRLHEGEERETIGDAFLVIFESALQAVECAVALQQELARFNKTRAPEKQLWTRIGIHVGDIIVEEGSIFGEGVNLAARVQTLPPPGGITITQQVWVQIKNRARFQVQKLGVRELKNITDVPDIYRVLFDSEAPPIPETRREKIERLLKFPPIRWGVPTLTILVSACFIYSFFFATHILLTSSVTFLYHAPHPIDSLSISEAAKLQKYIKLIKKGSKVIRMEMVNKKGIRPEDIEEFWSFQTKKTARREYPVIEFSYAKGRVSEKRVYDDFGILQHKLLFKEQGQVATIHDASGFVSTLENQISSFGYRFDERGSPMRQENRNAFGALRNDALGVAIYLFSSDQKGRTLKQEHYDALGNLIENKDGIATITFEYDNHGFLKKEIATDRYGTPKEMTKGYALLERIFHVSGNISEERYFDRNSSPIETNDGICIKRFLFSEDGFPTEEISFSCANSAKTNRFGWASRRFVYENKQLKELLFFDEEKNPTADATGIHLIRIEHDANGRIESLHYHDITNAPAVNHQQIHAVRYRYDDKGHPISRTSLGRDESLLISSAGYAEVRLKYDDRGNVTEQGYFDTEGNFINTHEGYALVKIENDSFGNQISRSYYGKKEEPASSRRELCHVVSFQYDKKGDVAQTSCLDEKLQPTLGHNGCAISKTTYDQAGKLTVFECYAAEGKLINDSTRFSVLHIDYDKRGYMSEIQAFDAEGNLSERYQGAATWRFKSDAFGNQIEIAFYNKSNELMMNPKYHAAIVRREYDERGNEARAVLLDEKENPIIGIWGYAEQRLKHDERGHRISEAYFDEAGNPATNRIGVHEYRWTYDEQGRARERYYYGKDGQLILNSEGVAMYRYEFDEFGHMKRVHYYGTHQELVVHRQKKAAIEEFKVDDRGNTIRISRFDEEGIFCQSKECIPITEQQFDTKGRLLKRSFRDAQSQPIVDENNVGAYLFEYDTQGRVALEKLYNAADEPMTDKLKVHQYQLHYRPDADDVVWYSTYGDMEGARATAKDGSSVQIHMYDALYQRKKIATANVTSSGAIMTIDCYDDLDVKISKKDCVVPSQILNEFEKIKPQLLVERK